MEAEVLEVPLLPWTQRTATQAATRRAPSASPLRCVPYALWISRHACALLTALPVMTGLLALRVRAPLRSKHCGRDALRVRGHRRAGGPKARETRQGLGAR